ncbi:tRNA adenosine(34) deaminase TadA [Candidatus Curculioniphilus buchneri]|uniref:tRNA adenosine(34) deaminase TadA n=1 Tax=Candidatus Curculioniphilus buchneri TaxID=690594 RepID=UPI00376EB120
MNKLCNDEKWMQHAITLAYRAEAIGEVPVGAVLVLNDRIIGEGWNCSIERHDPTAHAEIMAVRQGGEKIGNYRLLHSTLYVTLEPCVMCAGALIHARISRLFYGTKDKKSGAVSSQLNVLSYSGVNHRVIPSSGLLERSCSIQLSQFFQNRRLYHKHQTKRLST